MTRRSRPRRCSFRLRLRVRTAVVLLELGPTPSTRPPASPIDVLVNNVGAVRPRVDGFLNVTDEDWGWALSVNLLTAVRATRAALPHLLASGAGCIPTQRRRSGPMYRWWPGCCGPGITFCWFVRSSPTGGHSPGHCPAVG
ncbi:SDR family NAD(P)-dependent oxidoreductase [Kitasatospora sp. NPDC058032]|uniref:SDR family NAD(P)-dependent oxidoreductase n=1 Tax=Kitasatospora sp. NPDC058032 TaxID=3346307 RepID=UPI0036DA0F3E